MTIHSYSENIQVANAFPAAALTASTQSGAGVDTQANGGPFRRAALVVNLNTGAATTANYNLQDSPDNSTWTTVSGATLGTAQAASTSGVYIVNIDMAKRQRYLRCQIIGTGTAGAASAELHQFNGQYLAPTQLSTAQYV